MKIHAITTLLTAVFISGFPTESPQQKQVRPDLEPSASADRPFDEFVGQAVEIAWESEIGSRTSLATSNSPQIDLPLEAEQPRVMADDSAEDPGLGEIMDDSAFGAFSQLAEAAGDGSPDSAGASAGGQNEWDIAGSMAEQAGALGERLSDTEDAISAAAGVGATTGESDMLASGFGQEDDTPRSSSMEIQTVTPGSVAGATGELADGGDAVEGEVAAVDQQIVSDDEGMWIRSARLNDVFQYLARLGNLQYFHNSDLDAPNFVVTGHLRDGDPIKQMEELGLMYGITIYQKGSTVYAMTSAQLSQLPTRPFQYSLRYLRPTDIDQIKAILQPMLTPGTGLIEFEPKTNTLIIIDNEQRVDVISEILGGIDRPKMQIAIETRILRINTSSSNKIGVDWTSVLGEGLTIDAEQSLNALFGLPDSDTVSEVVTLTNNVLTGSSNAFEGEATYSEDHGGGFLNGAPDGADVLGGWSSGLTETTTYGNSREETTDRTFTRNQSVDITGSNLVLTPVQLTATIRALNAGGLAQQESSPTLITEDNEQGIISIIDRIPIVTATLSETDAGQNVTEEVRYRIDPDDPTISEDPALTREIGVSIAVTPTILPDNTIRMALRPRSAQITGQVIGRSGNIFPRVNESSVETIARIPNGSSLLIGGFYEEVEGEDETKVPVLGDIPLLKFFFSSSEKTKSHTSLIFVVTPKLYEPASARDTSFTTQDLHQRHVVPSDHGWPDRQNPGNNYEANLGWTMGNMVDAYDPIPPSNPLHPEHPVNVPGGPGYPSDGRRTQFEAAVDAQQVQPQPEPKRRGLLHRLFNRDSQ